MSNEDKVVTLPEITVEGSADSLPTNASDWWCQGFVTGFNAPDMEVDRPLMINDELAASFFAGVESGRNSSWDMQAGFDDRYRDSPQVVPDIRGEAYDEVQRRFNEAWEVLLHEHMPHTEVDSEPGLPPTRPNIVLVPE